MKKYEKNDLVFFGEWVPFDATIPEEKEEARQYLILWKKILLKKLHEELHDYEEFNKESIDSEGKPLSEQWVEKDAMYTGPCAVFSSLGLKFAMRKKLPYQL